MEPHVEFLPDPEDGHTDFPWCTIHDDGVSDRFATEQEAIDALNVG